MGSVTAAPRIVSRLRFTDAVHPEEGGELRLQSDARFVFAPSPALKARLLRTLRTADDLAHRWGVTAVYGLAALGAALWCKDRKNAAGTAFAGAGGVGVLGYLVRNGTRQIAASLETPRPLSEVRLLPGNDGGITVALLGRRLNKILFTLGAGEFDADEAEAFLNAVDAARQEK